MLAEKIRNLAAHFEDHRTSGLPMTETQARAFGMELNDCANQADAMSRNGQPSDQVAIVPDGKHEIKGKIYMGDGRGGFQPIETIKAQHLLEDEVTRKIISYAIPLSEQVGRFKSHSFADISGHEAVLAQEYNATLGGRKGNKTLQTVDALFKVQIRIADHLEFGPELQTAKSLFDQCLNEWAADTQPELRSLVTDAFQTDKAGNINRTRIFMLLRVDSEDERFLEAQRATRDAIRVVGSKAYILCHRRESYDAEWKLIPINVAKV